MPNQSVQKQKKSDGRDNPERPEKSNGRQDGEYQPEINPHPGEGHEGERGNQEQGSEPEHGQPPERNPAAKTQQPNRFEQIANQFFHEETGL